MDEFKANKILGIYGSGGLGREVLDLAVRINAIDVRWKDIAFIDDVNSEGLVDLTARMSLSTFLDTYGSLDTEVVVAVGEPSLRMELFNKVIKARVGLATLIDPSAIISPSAIVGDGSIVFEFSTVHTGVVLNDNVLIQPFCDVGHDIKVGKHSVLSPFCAPGGEVVIGECAFVGMRAAIMEKLTIGDGAIVAMGSAVFRDVPAHATVVGNPARVTKGKDERKVFS